MGVREPFCSLSHYLGAGVFAGLTIPLIRQGRGDPVRVAGLATFGIATVILLLLSGTYHIFWPGPLREFFLRADVAAVFLLIAGSMTPVHTILFTGLARWGALVLIWFVAITGILWRLLFCGTSPGVTGIAFFLLFGWGSVFSAIVLWRRYGWKFVKPAVLSGLAYTIGAIVLIRRDPALVPGWIGSHEIWHVAVLCGLALHWQFVSQFACGHGPAEIRRPSLTVKENDYDNSEPFCDQSASLDASRGDQSDYEKSDC
ncbi:MULTISPECIES: PAQR family membrane homeostasis protein TrhA [unclassified Schlesneria]|uniref:PAQR family membrane homeostasis protein TrhA n=1 Tax=unclassified Schlesneria TaxID=2762017 RepID=UPI002F036E3A